MNFFFIVGAQKSGTTSLASALAKHPEICMSQPKEPMFLSVDDPAIHPHFFNELFDSWSELPHHYHPDEVLPQYLKRYFAHRKTESLLGEASTSYLPSVKAAHRIASLFDQPKVIVVLREPVARAYSAYWHYLHHGRSTESFERHLQYEQGLTLEMGNYYKHLHNWLMFIPKKNVLVVDFEEIKKSGTSLSVNICRFLGISEYVFSFARENQSVYPISQRFKRLSNQLHREYKTNKGVVRVLSWLDKRNKAKINKYPMCPQTRRRLEVYYRVSNQGLGQLVSEINEASLNGK